MEAVIKVERKPASGLKHIRRYSMPVVKMRQEGILKQLVFIRLSFLCQPP